MIFVTLGSQKFQFNRLLRKIDELIENGTIVDKVFAQIGYSDYQPKLYSYTDFMDRNEFDNKMEHTTVVITHGGTGAIINAVKKGKKVIAIPRLAKYGEHVDDHQLQLLSQFDNMGIIVAVYDIEKLAKNYMNLKNIHLNSYVSSTRKIISNIDMFLSALKK